MKNGATAAPIRKLSFAAPHRPESPEVVRDFNRLMTVFLYIAEGLKLSRDAEEQISRALPPPAAPGEKMPGLWEHLQDTGRPHAPAALRAMPARAARQALSRICGIDSLVIRDFYHHYTVDAHSHHHQNIHHLRQPQHDWERAFTGIFSAEQRIAFLALFHDVGKGCPATIT